MVLFEDSFYNASDSISKDAVLLGFEFLFEEMQTHLRESEEYDLVMCSKEDVIKRRRERDEYCKHCEISHSDSSRSSVESEVQEARNELEYASGYRIQRADEIRAMHDVFKAKDVPDEKVVHLSMLLFRQMTLRSVLYLVSDECDNMEITSERINTYAGAYKALSTASESSKLWFPFDDWLM